MCCCSVVLCVSFLWLGKWLFFYCWWLSRNEPKQAPQLWIYLFSDLKHTLNSLIFLWLFLLVLLLFSLKNPFYYCVFGYYHWIWNICFGFIFVDKLLAIFEVCCLLSAALDFSFTSVHMIILSLFGSNTAEYHFELVCISEFRIYRSPLTHTGTMFPLSNQIFFFC